MIERQTLTITTDADEDGSAVSQPINGSLRSIHYVKDDYTDGVDFTITGAITGQTLWTETNVNASKVCAPRLPTHSTAGVAALYASGGTAVNDRIALAEPVSIIIASGGATKSGTFHLVWER